MTRSERSGRSGGVPHLAPLLAAGLVVLTACESGPDPVEQLPDEEAVPAVAMGFFEAMERRDFEGAKPFATEATQEYLDLSAEFFGMVAEMEDFEEPGEETSETNRLAGFLVDGDEAQAEVVTEFEGEEQSLVLLLAREARGWGVYGVQLEDKPEPDVFTDRIEEAREMVAEATKERAGHPELAPVVRAWIEAVIAKDFDAANALLTPECAESEADSERSFTNGFRNGEFSIEKWAFSRSEVEENEGRQTVRTKLRLKNGEMDGEPIRFRCVRTTTGWRIAEID